MYDRSGTYRLGENPLTDMHCVDSSFADRVGPLRYPNTVAFLAIDQDSSFDFVVEGFC